MFTIGADPEIFVKKNGNPFSAHDLVPGTKESPHKTTVGAIQVDGLALEFNIDPVPQLDFEAFNYNIVKTISDLRAAVGKGYNFNIASVQDFGKELLEKQPAKALELGCDPDWNAYTEAVNPSPDAKEVTYRTGAGHIHIGWGTDIPVDNVDHIKICSNFIKMLDGTVGMFMTCIDRDPRRRELYGKAGAFRPKPYGVEYRTPSNLWIVNRNRRQIVHSLLNTAIKNQKNNAYDRLFTGYNIERIINTGDVDAAKYLLNNLIVGYYSPITNILKKEIEKVEKDLNNAEG